MPPTAATWSPGDHRSLPQLDTDPTAQQRPSHVTLTPSSVPMNSRERPRSRPSPVDGYTQRLPSSGSSADTAPNSLPAHPSQAGRPVPAPSPAAPPLGWHTCGPQPPSPLHLLTFGMKGGEGRVRQVLNLQQSSFTGPPSRKPSPSMARTILELAPALTRLFPVRTGI